MTGIYGGRQIPGPLRQTIAKSNERAWDQAERDGVEGIQRVLNKKKGTRFAVAQATDVDAHNRDANARSRLRRVLDAREAGAVATGAMEAVPNWNAQGTFFERSPDGERFQAKEVVLVDGVENAQWNNRLVRIHGPLHKKKHAGKVSVQLLESGTHGAVHVGKLRKVTDEVFQSLHVVDRKLLERLGTRQVPLRRAATAEAEAADAAEAPGVPLTLEQAMAIGKKMGYRVDAKDDGSLLMERLDEPVLSTAPVTPAQTEATTALEYATAKLSALWGAEKE